MEITKRQSYLDWLRILSIAGVLLLHSAMPYADHLSWHIKNQEKSTLLYLFVIGLHLVRMPLLFFISGTVSFYMMQRRSALNFIGLRCTRLLIPLLTGMLLIVPPQIYMERLAGGFSGSYWDFYKSVFYSGMYPKGNLSWHHLWFIAYLFIYDLLFAPVFMYLISDRSLQMKQVISRLSAKKYVFLLALPSILWFVFVCGDQETMPDLIHDGPYFIYWLLFVLAGFMCILVPSLMESLQRNRRFSAGAGFISLLLFYFFVLQTKVPEHVGDSKSMLLSLFVISLRPFTAWAFVFALIGYGKQYLNKPHSSLNYLNQAVYPFYIIHQTVIVILVYYITAFNDDSVLMKYSCTVGITLVITIGIFNFFIKPFRIMQFLFGMKTPTGLPRLKTAETKVINEHKNELEILT